MVFLDELPIEILVKVFSYLPSEDISFASLVSKRFYEASEFECIWKTKCYEEFHILSTGSNLSFKEVYTRLLYSHGRLIGLWHKPSLNAAFHVEYDGGSLKCKMWVTPTKSNELFEAIKYEPHFDIVLNADLKVEYVCYASLIKDPYHNIPAYEKVNENICNFLAYEKQTRTTLASIRKINYDDETFSIIQTDREMRKKFPFDIGICPIQYKRIDITTNKLLNVPIQPGLFCGTYGPHGVECIALSYKENGSYLVAKKITGDENVPADQISFRAHLNHSIILNKSDQECIDTMQLLEPELVPYNAHDNVQIFKIPENCYTDVKTELPKTCTARFEGEGQVAETHFLNNEFLKGHFIVFNEDLCAFLWFALDCLSIYRRAHEITKYIPGTT